MKKIRIIPLKIALIPVLFFLCSTNWAGAQKRGHSPSPDLQNQVAGPLDQISGMYSFLREGEFVQITVDNGKLSGFVSRFGDHESDQGVFLDQFFTKTALKGDALSFTTKAVHGAWFEFTGHIRRGEVPSKQREGYWVMTGTLKQLSEDETGQVSEKSREVTFKSFPDLDEQ